MFSLNLFVSWMIHRMLLCCCP